MTRSKKAVLWHRTAVGGLSGAFIPVSEDQGMIDAVTAGSPYYWRNWKQ